MPTIRRTDYSGLALAVATIAILAGPTRTAAEPASGQPAITPAEIRTTTDGVTTTYYPSEEPAAATTTSKAMHAAASPRVARPSIGEVVAEIGASTGVGLEKVRISEQTGLVTFLAPKRFYPVTGFHSAGAPAEARARGFMTTYGAAFGIYDSRNLALIRSTSPDEVGIEHVRFRQTHRGVPVTGGELTLHLRGANLVAVNAKTLPGLENIDVVPDISAGDAADVARVVLAKHFGVTDANLSEPRLEIFNQGLLEGRTSMTRLAWFIEATRIDLREFIWVDAATGTPLLNFSQLNHAKDRKVYDADNDDDLEAATLVRSEGEPATGDADVNAAYDYAGDTYDYFFDEHGRDSYDDEGAAIVSSVHYCQSGCPFVGAFWNGAQMVYGEGFPAADDIVAHELTHAVTEYTANLFSYMQSGALNESFSDIFGETVDLSNTGGTDTTATRWQIGEDRPGSGAIRNMMDPTLFGGGDPHPGKTSDAICAEANSLLQSHPNDDNGGVHSNSGVPNHAYALMVDGGTYNGFTVTDIGLAKAGKIQYRSLSHYLLSASDFEDNYNALKQSCQDLIGTAGITTADCAEVGKALDAVEMASDWPCSPAQSPAPDMCPAGEAPNVWHYEDFESSSVTDCPADVLPADWCLNGPVSKLGAFATSGVKSLWGYDRKTPGTITSEPWLGGTLPADAKMQFNHAFGFEVGSNNNDGGVVEYSTDGGSNWMTNAGGLITAGRTYTGTINSGSNPLVTRMAFVADSWGYTASQLDLSTLGGGSFAYHFRVGTDSGVDDYGWFVDDVRIYTCAACIADRVLDNAYNGMAWSYSASNSIEAGAGFTVDAMENVTLDAPVVALSNGFAAEGELTIGNAGCGE